MSGADRTQDARSEPSPAESLLAYVRRIHRLENDDQALLKLAFEAGYRHDQAGAWTKSDAVQQYENLIRRQHFLIVKLKQQIDQRSHQSLSSMNPLSPSSAPSVHAAPGPGGFIGRSSVHSGTTSLSSGPPSPVSSGPDLPISQRFRSDTPPAIPTPPDSPLATLADSVLLVQPSRPSQQSSPSSLPPVAQPPRTPQILPHLAAAIEAANAKESKMPGKRSFSLADFEIDTERLTGAKRTKLAEPSRPPEFAVPFQVTPFSVLANSNIGNLPDTSPNLVSRLAFPPTPPLPSVTSMMQPPIRTLQSTQYPPISMMQPSPVHHQAPLHPSGAAPAGRMPPRQYYGMPSSLPQQYPPPRPPKSASSKSGSQPPDPRMPRSK
eukprot:TRINITY_DN13842_c0_g1_i1.p1 TRINITY_DN13842_c0_g1~~TRINITY_DN13842_c0_g1_i1.p1  ORF type:complete len:379 (+),score=43.12 TRINITY_DN13842_c0_g1_i1:227-1363(+)